MNPRRAADTAARVSPRKLGEQVVRVVAARIVNHELDDERRPPTEQDICDEFGVSKTTAREVIGSLAAKGLVDVRHGRRMRVRPPSEWNQFDPLLLELRADPETIDRYMAELHDVRMLVEPEMAARAATLATQDQLERMRDLILQMRPLEDQPDAYLEVDVAFHNVLAEASGNLVLAYILDSVRELMRASRKRANTLSELPGATRAHRQIYDGIHAREPEIARQAMRAHLLAGPRAWGREIEDPDPGGAA
ncbi:MAG TPA: FadR/GntR family transcriptional regulator [Gaiellales bacterium]|jgi:DNA-binding FadR family transcriptional regulator